ncbi:MULTISPECIES: STAS domain-containing protein [Undibacterium]|uniref:STAS domain-containing protein n=1 Tax=Undibacterium umbellatum TaxID=2762300 RepID=A0ABR6ZEA6_9BURK|nr:MULTISPECIES: STAS domain-containing protein [Undibacterium]MBC3910071.1 STAS domain-containing protein [Undibacterium umbellatum]MDP1979915.1 STAS domain-containing protein [Undibacterium sp.]
MYTVTGELSHGNANAVVAAGLSALAEGQSEFDLSALTKIDSSAVAVMIAWQRQAIQQGLKLHFTGVPASLLSILALYGLNEQFQLHTPERH